MNVGACTIVQARRKRPNASDKISTSRCWRSRTRRSSSIACSEPVERTRGRGVLGGVGEVARDGVLDDRAFGASGRRAVREQVLSKGMGEARVDAHALDLGNGGSRRCGGVHDRTRSAWRSGRAVAWEAGAGTGQRPRSRLGGRRPTKRPCASRVTSTVLPSEREALGRRRERGQSARRRTPPGTGTPSGPRWTRPRKPGGARSRNCWPLCRAISLPTAPRFEVGESWRLAGGRPGRCRAPGALCDGAPRRRGPRRRTPSPSTRAASSVSSHTGPRWRDLRVERRAAALQATAGNEPAPRVARFSSCASKSGRNVPLPAAPGRLTRPTRSSSRRRRAARRATSSRHRRRRRARRRRGGRQRPRRGDDRPAARPARAGSRTRPGPRRAGRRRRARATVTW